MGAVPLLFCMFAVRESCSHYILENTQRSADKSWRKDTHIWPGRYRKRGWRDNFCLQQAE